MYNWIEQGLFVVQWLLVIVLLHVSLWSALKRWIPEYAYPVSYPASLLVFGIATWWLSVVHLPAWIALFLILILPGIMIWRGECKASDLIRYLKWDLLFLVFFSAMLITRMKNSAIFAYESFLDMGFIASIMRNPVVPPLDPQFAGGYLDMYYYFSHWIYASVGLISHVPPSIVYNLILPTTLGLSAVCCLAIGTIIIPRFPFIPLLLLVVPRPSFFSGLLSEYSLGFTRVIEDSVKIVPGAGHTYPYYDLLWGIPHPYVNALPLQLFLLLLLLLVFMKWDILKISGRRMILLLTGITAGLLVPVNSWDALVYYPLIICLVLVVIRKILLSADSTDREPGHPGNPDIHSIFLMLAVGLLTVVPYLTQSRIGGITRVGFVHEPSVFIPFLLVHAWYLVIFYLYLFPDIRKKPYFLFVGFIPVFFGYGSVTLLLIPLIYLVIRKKWTIFDYLAGYGLLVLIFTEFLYLQEVLTPDSRFNTVFKFSSAVWPVLWVAAFGMTAPFFSKNRFFSTFSAEKGRIAGVAVCIIICLLYIAAPIEPFFPVFSIDGSAYLEIHQPDDAKVIALLKADRSATGIVEAAGDFDYHARIATFTGIPAIIGWPSIESQWGRNSTEVSQRVHDVESVYGNPERASDIMDTYKSSHLVIGKLEMVKYGDTDPVQKEFMTQYEENNTRLYRLIA
jgi:YYY domain-containing protein